MSEKLQAAYIAAVAARGFVKAACGRSPTADLLAALRGCNEAVSALEAVIAVEASRPRA